MGAGSLILSYGQGNKNSAPLFHFPSVSYITQNSGWLIALFATCFHAGFLLGLFLDPEEGGDMFLRNVS
jgi:hypothetical protein